MDINLANTISGFTCYVKDVQPDLIVVHGDRPEALAGAIVGSFNNILVGHVEGGEVSGTIDDLIRHSITKLSHAHFVSNEEAGKRLLQMGESWKTVFELGSPELDVMFSEDLPPVEEAKKHYEVDYSNYAILVYHPVTTEISELSDHIKVVVDSVIESDINYLVITPNNDSGSDIIVNEYERFNENRKITIFPSIRFEYYLTLLKNCQFIIGNSSSGVREASAYGVPSINVGSRQTRRYQCEQVIEVSEDKAEILKAIGKVAQGEFICTPKTHFGDGNSALRFENILKVSDIWSINIQKQFIDHYKK